MFYIIRNIYVKYKRQTPLVLFIINLLLILISVVFFYFVFRRIQAIDHLYQAATHYFTEFLLNKSAFCLQLMGYKTEINGKIISIYKHRGVLLDRGCLARNLILSCAVFIIAFPHAFLRKLMFVIIGVSLIVTLNILRITGLVWTMANAPQWTDINHDIIFKYTTWSFVLILWWIYIYGGNRKSRTKKIQ